MAQLVAISWLEHEKKEAEQIRRIFLDFKNNDFERQSQYFLIQVKWDTFEGSLQEIPQPSVKQEGPYFIMTLPYPPKPSAENINLNHVLRAWLTSKVDVNKPQETVSDPFPPVPYLPTTCT
ncbi:MAG: hypothetical protein GPJ04_17995 [Microcystis aeruginosa G13-03]|nr:hypothetical protein [Microcystis aeruginosa G13-03]